LLSKAGDPLEKLEAVVPWDVFRKPLARALKRSDGSKGGRPAFDTVMMFKVLVLQALYNLSDDQAEFVINDRLSFMRFLGLGLGDKAPDAKTIWLFREHLTQARAIDNLFAWFDKHLNKAGYLAMGGQIVDATLVVSRCYRPEVFEFVEESFHQITGLVKIFAEDRLDAALWHGWNIGPRTALGNGGADGIAIVCAVRQHHCAGLQMPKQSMGIMAVICLALG